MTPMTGQQWEDHARREIQQLGHALIAQGCPAGAFRSAIQTVRGFGLQWEQTCAERLADAKGEAKA